MQAYFVRIGSLGHVGRFAPVEPYLYRRSQHVICRTARGLEVGEVLGPGPAAADSHDGQLLRRMTVEDNLLWARLERRKQEAFDACTQLLVERELVAVLVEIEPLFDGQSIYFHFLGPVSPAVSAVTQELAEAYESRAQLGPFAATLAAGCGPACGTDEAAGCGQGGCSTCAVIAACGKQGAAK